MAFIDYGAITKKNGKILNKEDEFFQDMKSIVGFEVEELLCKDKSIKIKNEYFTYLGDKDLLVCIYKNIVNIFSVSQGEYLHHEWDLLDEGHKDVFRKIIKLNGVKIDIKRIDDGSRFKLRMLYKNNLWECVYGYGVSLNIRNYSNVDKKLKKFVLNWLRK